MHNFAKLLADLRQQDPDKPLILTTDRGTAGAGYHVTELRHSLSTGIDCGGQIDSWHEARLQILDGSGGSHMPVGKLCGILEKSLSALPQLAEAPLLVEFGHDNAALTLMSVGAPQAQADHVTPPLGHAHAVCKPVQRMSAEQGCCA